MPGIFDFLSHKYLSWRTPIAHISDFKHIFLTGHKGAIPVIARIYFKCLILFFHNYFTLASSSKLHGQLVCSRVRVSVRSCPRESGMSVMPKY